MKYWPDLELRKSICWKDEPLIKLIIVNSVLKPSIHIFWRYSFSILRRLVIKMWVIKHRAHEHMPRKIHNFQEQHLHKNNHCPYSRAQNCTLWNTVLQDCCSTAGHFNHFSSINLSDFGWVYDKRTWVQARWVFSSNLSSNFNVLQTNLLTFLQSCFIFNQSFGCKRS